MTNSPVAITVVGSANADLVVQVPRRPLGGETLLGGELQTLPGGKGANQAVAAGKAGGSVAFVGCVGADGNGDLLRASLESSHVRVETLGSTDSPTGTAIITVTPDGENSIVVCPGANHDLTVAEASRSAQAWRDARITVLSLEIPMETVEHVARDATAHDTRVVMNAAPALRLSAEVLAVCDPLIVNEHEALEVLGASINDPDASDYEALAKRLLHAGARSVVITVGAQGAVVAQDNACEHLPAFAVTPVDTTGAGDAFVGALSAELSRDTTLTEAVIFAQAMAALSVERFGAQPSYVDEASVRAFVAERSS